MSRSTVRTRAAPAKNRPPAQRQKGSRDARSAAVRRAALRYCGMERRRGYSAPVTVRLAAAGWPLTIVTERGVTGFVVTEVTPAGSTSVSS